MTSKKPKADQGRPTEQTPCGLLYTDTPAYAWYAEARQVRDWHKTFLDDLEHLRIDGASYGCMPETSAPRWTLRIPRKP